MARIVEDHWGEQLFLQGSDCDLSVDRRAGRLTFTRHFVIGKSREQTIELDRLEGLTIMADGFPAMSTRLVGKLLRGVLNAHKEGPADLGELMSELPMGIRLRLLEHGDSSSAKPNEVRFSVETLRDRQSLVEFAFKLAAAAGLHYGAVFAIPNAGLQIRLRSRHGPNLGRLPGRSGEAEDSGLGDAASEALAAAKVPSFEPSTFHCDHKVLEWSPGKRVVFRRPFRWAATFIFPFTLLVFTGPGIYVFSKLNSKPMDLAVTSFLTLFGSVIGGVAIVVVVMLLPREIEIDWMSRQIAARTWFRSRKLRFDELERLDSSPSGRGVREENRAAGRFPSRAICGLSRGPERAKTQES